MNKPSFLSKKRLFLQLFAVLFLFSGLIAGSFLVRKTQDIRKKAQVSIPTLGNDYFKVSYDAFRNYYGSIAPVQVFSGGLILREFYSDAFPHPYSGHIGSFWAPPYFSEAAFGKSEEAFHNGLTIYSPSYKTYAHENNADHIKTKAYWSPAKMEVENYYQGAGGELVVKGTKMSIPDVRGFAHKLTFTNQTTAPQVWNILISNVIPKLGKDTDWNWGYAYVKNQYKDLKAYYDNTLNAAIVYSPSQNIYFLLGIQEGTVGWEIKDYSNWLESVYNFRTSGSIKNSGQDEDIQNGSAVHFSVNLPELGVGNSTSFTLLGFVGGSSSEVVSLWNNYRNKGDLENLVDESWNAKISNIFANKLPRVSFGDKELEKMYYNSSLQYLLHRWETLKLVNEQNYQGNSVAFFPWTTGTQMILAQADPAFWRQQLIKLFNLDLSKCRAYSPFDNHRCDASYTYDPFALVNLMAEYIFLTGGGDTDFLKSLNPKGERYIDLLADRIIQIDSTAGGGDANLGATKLADFGDDINLYEFTLSESRECSYDGQYAGGLYTGLVPSPNGERYMAHLLLSKLYTAIGETENANKHISLAQKNKTALNSLYNETQGWFDTISMYEARYNSNDPKVLKPQPYPRLTMYFQPIFNLLDYENLLTDSQKQALLEKVDSFTGPYGYYSLAKDKFSNCTRIDFHGPGLYSGSIGLMTSDLFTHNLKEKAYENLKRYSYLANIPVWNQQYHAEKPLLESHRSWYIESVSFAQALIKGMMGLTPALNETWLKPRIPEALLDKGPVEFSRAYAQTHLWSLKAQKGEPYTFEIDVSHGENSVDHFRFGWDSDKSGIIKIQNLDAVYKYKITDDSNRVIFPNKEVTNGVLEFDLDTEKRIVYINNIVNVTPLPTIATPIPTALPTVNILPGDTDNDGDVDEEDYGRWLMHYNPAVTQTGGSSIGDFNGDSKVDGIDYTIWLNHYGT